jgi:type IV pilus assembly protein PilE
MKALKSSWGQRGVTLIELLIVIVIVSILAAIAIPGYRQYVMRIKRTDAKTQLMSLSSRLERCFTRSNDFRLSGDAAGNACVALGFTNPEGTYQFTGVVNQLNYLLTATPVGGQASDARCTTLTINQAGLQNATGTMSADECWQGR